MITTFHEHNFSELCHGLAQKDEALQGIIAAYGLPPMWTRPNSFATLVLIILEQQVSISAAYAAFIKLKGSIGEPTPEKILAMSDEELRACYFTRQKRGYVRGLATAVLEGSVNLARYESMTDAAVRAELTQLKGIGHWTVDIYLLQALRRTDVFPIGDIALVAALKETKGLDKTTSKEALLQLAEPWRPHRSMATMLLWHHYLRKRNRKGVDPYTH